MSLRCLTLVYTNLTHRHIGNLPVVGAIALQAETCHVVAVDSESVRFYGGRIRFPKRTRDMNLPSFALSGRCVCFIL